MSLNRNILIRTIQERMVKTPRAVRCSAGEMTTTYLDIPGALRDKQALNNAAVVLFEHCNDAGLPAYHVMWGGPTTGAIPLVMGVTLLNFVPSDTEWFIVRDKVKDHGLGRAYVGAEPGPGDKVILTDDVVSSGDSMVETIKKVQETGATIVAVVPLVDRGNVARAKIEALGVKYLPVMTYADLDLPPLGA